ncbi:Flagellar biosynthesis protein FliR [hydrothermal vent metagenome]|uniref:Flagellar biosynthesis protein FliR n=1 Tax=hydrothermal vent metagenome TaxID=652676 RepID=A0A3B1AXS5_9ZZZZ
MIFTEAAIATWLASFLWPLMRISAVFVAAPIFASRQVPVRWRAALALVITWIVMPVLPPAPVVETFSHDAAMIAMQQIAIGVFIGFVLQMVFAALVFGGQVMAYSMGLGFASMMDPQNGVQVPVVSQYYMILATLAFLVLNGHLILIELMIDSFTTLPIAVDGLTRNTLWEIASWGGRIFAGGLLMSLPVVTALLLVNLGMGIIARAAPQLNIFAVGFPMAMLIGFLLMWVTIPDVLHNFGLLVNEGFQMIMSNLGIVR